MEIRKVTLREKRYYPNASYVMITDTKKQYYTQKAIVELQSKLNKLLIADVSKCYTCHTTKGDLPKGDNYCNMCDHYF